MPGAIHVQTLIPKHGEDVQRNPCLSVQGGAFFRMLNEACRSTFCCGQCFESVSHVQPSCRDEKGGRLSVFSIIFGPICSPPIRFPFSFFFPPNCSVCRKCMLIFSILSYFIFLFLNFLSLFVFIFFEIFSYFRKSPVVPLCD